MQELIRGWRPTIEAARKKKGPSAGNAEAQAYLTDGQGPSIVT